MAQLCRLFFILLIFISAARTSAQVIGESSSERIDRTGFAEPTLRSVEAGISFMRLSPLSSNEYTGYRFTLSRPGLAVSLNQDGALIYLDYSNGDITTDTVTRGVSMLTAGVKFSIDLETNRQSSLRLLVPLAVLTDFVLASASNVSTRDNLSLSSIGVAGGLGVKFVTRRLIAVARAQAFIAFCNQGFSAITGTASGYYADATFEYPRLFGTIGFAATYRLKYAIHSLGENQFNYNAVNNALTLGITF